MDEIEPKDVPTSPVPYEPAQPPVIEQPERPIGYARPQPSVVEPGGSDYQCEASGWTASAHGRHGAGELVACCFD